jgi:hypothetical protein
MIVTLSLLGAFWLITNKELGFPIAINWALYGIYFSHYGTNIDITALVNAIALDVAMAIALILLLRAEYFKLKQESVDEQLSKLEMTFGTPTWDISPPPYEQYETFYSPQVPLYEYTIIPSQIERPSPSAPQMP